MPRVEPAAAGFSAERMAEVTAFIQAAIDQGRIAGAVAAVARNGQIAYMEALGLQDLESRTPMSERSLFRIYSMTKAVTSVAAMILWEENRFELDDPVSKYIPEFSRVRVQDGDALRAPTREITVRDLMLHTSGLNHRTSAQYRELQVRRRDLPMSQFIENIVAAPLMEDPGTRYRYSEGTTVLGALIEIWSGQSLDRFFQERILDRLGMADTGFWVRPLGQSRLATVYQAQGGSLTPIELEEVPFTERPGLLEGAVGLVSTVPDFLRFSQMLLDRGEYDGQRILEAATVDSLVVNGLSDAVMEERPGTMGWGLGNVNVVMDPATLGYPAGRGEYGWDGSAGTIFWNDPESRISIVLMWQNQPANPGSLRQNVKTLVYGARSN
jgi:CubicO group peptidase (beta-lactamase class C family)